MEYELLDKIDSPADIKKLSIVQLKALAEEIRQFLIEHVLQNGGHLASNLGVVEVTLALHYVFDVPTDKLIWDVGHQSYVHKIITGRKQFETLRKKDGISGFPQVKESDYDIFDTGHSSTALSVASGMANARDLLGEKYSVIALIGDGAFAGGMTFEAVNELGQTKSKVIVVLNDNEMCISKNVGLLSNNLYHIRTSKRYERFKKLIERILGKDSRVSKATKRLKDSIRYLLQPCHLFDEMGLKYIGVIDGHNIEELIEQFKRARDEEVSCLLHVVTQKGKGYSDAELDPEKYHGVAPFYIDKENGSASLINFSKEVGDKLTQMAEEDEKIVAISAAMISGTGLSVFQEKYPQRIFDVGICEQHAVTMAAAMAASGFKPYFAVYSSFMQRCYDQLLEDVALSGNKITLLIDRAGLNGEDGKTHQGIYDVALLRTIPDMVIMAPSSKEELCEMMELASQAPYPCTIRYTKKCYECSYDHIPVEYGKWVRLVGGQDIAIITHGRMLHIVESIEPALNDNGIYPTVINARFIKPLDETLLNSLYRYKHVFVIEDNIVQGGLGSAVIEYFSTHALKPAVVHVFGVRDEAVYHASIAEQLRQQELDGESLVKRITQIIGIKK